MKIIKDNEELKSYIVNGVARFNESIKCDFDICINADIDACDIKANNIEACDIKANNIEAGDVSYYAFCIVYQSLKCSSVEGRRTNSIHKCLDNPIEIIEKKTDIWLQGQKFKLNKLELENLKKQLK